MVLVESLVRGVSFVQLVFGLSNPRQSANFHLVKPKIRARIGQNVCPIRGEFAAGERFHQGQALSQILERAARPAEQMWIVLKIPFVKSEIGRVFFFFFYYQSVLRSVGRVECSAVPNILSRPSYVLPIWKGGVQNRCGSSWRYLSLRKSEGYYQIEFVLRSTGTVGCRVVPNL